MPIIGFNEEETSGKRRIVPRGQTDGRADMSKLVVTPPPPQFFQSLCEHSSLRREYTFERSAASYISNTSPVYVTTYRATDTPITSVLSQLECITLCNEGQSLFRLIHCVVLAAKNGGCG